MTMRPASTSVRMSRSDRIIGAMLPGVGDLDPPGEGLGGLAVVDRTRGGGHALFQAFGEPGDAQRRARVEDDDVAAGALLTVDDPAGDVGVVGSIAARELLRLDLAQAELRRVEGRLSGGFRLSC